MNSNRDCSSKLWGRLETNKRISKYTAILLHQSPRCQSQTPDRKTCWNREGITAETDSQNNNNDDDDDDDDKRFTFIVQCFQGGPLFVS